MEKNEEVVADTETSEGEGEVETLTIPKKDYEKLNQDLGSLKRELKDLKKSKDEPKEVKETPQTKPDNALLQRLEKMAFKQHNISHEDDMEIARNTAKKWGMEVEDVLEDVDFQVKLKKQQDSRANVEATSGVKGDSSGKTAAKSKSEYWIASNTPPSDEDVATNKIPRGELAKIMAHFIKNKGSNKVFYND